MQSPSIAPHRPSPQVRVGIVNLSGSPPKSTARALSVGGMIGSGVRHNWRVSAAVVLGVATATAVIVGALLVGDSMRGSLRGLTVERLGKTDSMVVPGAFFDCKSISRKPGHTLPLILFSSAVVETTGDASVPGAIRRAGNVQVIGCDDKFWGLDVSGVFPKVMPVGDEVILNESTAKELNAAIGDLLTLRLPEEQAVPADSPLGRRDVRTAGLPRMKVVDIVADRGLGRFAISASQAAPQNVYVPRETIAEALDRDGQANVLLFNNPSTLDDLSIDLEDLGFQLERVRQEFTPEDGGSADTIFDYYSLTSDRLLLSDVAVEKIIQHLPQGKVTPVTTYLANAIETLDDDGKVIASVPYSTITAIAGGDSLPLDFNNDKAVNSDVVPLVINDWTAGRLNVAVGAAVRVAYYEPEVERGKEIERYFDAVVTQIVPITKPSKPYYHSRPAKFDKPPTRYNDPALTPSVPGVTDQESMSDWDLPFKLERDIPTEDDLYWKEHRLTPKAFLPLADGERLFGSRFGKTTGLRIDPSVAQDMPALRNAIQSAIQDSYNELGWQVHPIREQQLAASKGTTPFDALFLSLSFFVIFAAVMLIAMLFRLGLIGRLKQFGTLLAIGWTPKKVTKLVLGEGLAIAAAGVVLGLIGGVVYAIAVLWALRNWWVGAVTVPFLDFHWTSRSLVIGALAGWLVAGLAIWFTIRSIMKVNAQTLLTGRDTDQQAGREQESTKRSKLPMIAIATAVLALIVAGVGATVGGQAAAGGFVGGGMLLLTAALLGVYVSLRRPRRIDSSTAKLSRYSIGSLAARNASRHPLRSTLTIGLMATAAFLIIAISAFRLQPTDRGTGGFNLIARTSQPLYRDLNDPDMQSDTFGPEASIVREAQIVPLRVRVGQDASCNNLYQASKPTVLGIPADFDPPAGFDWAMFVESETVSKTGDDESPWNLLNREATGTEEDPVPMILDQNTAMFSLQMYGGVGQGAVKSFEYEPGKPIYFRSVGLMMNSVLQGKLMIGEANFSRLFPDVSGYQQFMVHCRSDDQDAVSGVLEGRLSDVGMDVSDSKEVLSGMLAVQNTYLRTFQSLGALGLLLGTIGLAISQLRSILERRRELAVLRAVGFTRRRLAAVVMSETASLLLLGIGCGAVCAFLAVLPHALLSGLKPPIVEPALIVIGIILFGLLAGLVAVRRVIRIPLADALRPE